MNEAFDLRVPLGILFICCGAVLLVHGAWVGTKVVDININLWWGGVMLVFGGAMLALGLRARTR